VLGPLRTLISVAFLAILLWAACTIKLGRFTFAEHIDRIGQTDEAKELLDGTRSRISPGLEEIKQRMFGEYVEAPTHLAAPVKPAVPASLPRPRPEPVPATTSTAIRGASGPATPASTADAIKLPGRRKAAPGRPTP
jgi:hypothetical protein